MTTVATMSGALVMEHRRILAELCTQQGFERVIAELPADARERYLEASPLTWLSIDTAERVFVLAARHLDRDVAELHESVSRRAVERTLTTLWRFVLRLASDEALIARSQRIYSRAFQTGTLEARIVEPGRAEIKVHGWPDMPEFSLRGFRIAIETVLVLAGRENVRLSLQRTRSGPEVHATWRV